MYINLKQEKEILEKYLPLYLKYNKGINKLLKRKFLKQYKNLSSIIYQNNKQYIDLLKKENPFLNNIDGYKLDEVQKNIVLAEEENTLVVAGAGSGKTLTLLARIIYLIKTGVKPNEILCLTLTNSCVNNLKSKLEKYNITLDVLTFHKLGMRILRSNGYKLKVAKNDELSMIIDELVNYHKIVDIIPAVDFKTFGEYNDQAEDDVIKGLQDVIFKNSDYYNNLKYTILMFVNLFKNNTYLQFDDLFMMNNKEKNKYKRTRNYKYLLFLKDIYEKYTDYLQKNNKIDFNDMISKATTVLKKGSIRPYKYIIIDEYQDISLSKCLLLKEIQLHTKAHILAIGDDWQSIYRFTGTNLSVFVDFERYFPNTKIFKLNNTYRNSNELIKVMNKFIMKNKKQIAKKLLSNKTLDKPIIVYYYDNNQTEILNKILPNIKGSFLILGRNNNDINLVPKKYQKHFMTVHKSKGLECDVTIVINLTDDPLGFPNKIVNDDILKFVSIDDDFPYEEERRLFYVALTRTKTYNILLVDRKKPSVFAREITEDNNITEKDYSVKKR